MIKPLCFVLMPFGTKKDPTTGNYIDFDNIYESAILPAIEFAGMEPIRADEERTGGIIHKAMFERLMLCEYAVADLTTANANVFYELGVRHTVRPATTLAIFGNRHQLPFDVDFIRALPYSLGEGNLFSSREASILKRDLARRLEELKKLHVDHAVTDSPVFQLLTDYRAPDIERLKTDVFRERATYAAEIKNSLARARSGRDKKAIQAVESSLGPLKDVESGVLIDLFLSYRAVWDWGAMIVLYDNMPETLKRAVMVREQLGFAYNRLGDRNKAIELLQGVINEQGAGSENCGLLGRIYKDLWVEAGKAENKILANGYLDRAIDIYRIGFEADLRDAYPGINAVTLLDIKGTEEALELQAKLLPVVRFAVEGRLKSGKPDYWDHATLLELAVLANEESTAARALGLALSHVREPWEPETTANNLKLILKARKSRGVDVSWLDEVVAALENRAK